MSLEDALIVHAHAIEKLAAAICANGNLPTIASQGTAVEAAPKPARKAKDKAPAAETEAPAPTGGTVSSADPAPAAQDPRKELGTLVLAKVKSHGREPVLTALRKIVPTAARASDIPDDQLAAVIAALQALA